MLVDEGFLHPDEMVEAMALLRGTHVEHAPFGHVDIVDVIGEGQAIFDVGRLEGGIALDQCDAADEGLRRNEAAVLAEHVEAAGARRRLDPVRDREGARLRSEEHTSELQSLMRISYAVFCLKKKTHNAIQH